MNLRCIKTGCHVYLINEGVYVYGDAFQTIGDALIIRAVSESDDPMFTRLHFRANSVMMWDREAMETGRVCTIVSEQWTNLGYDGEELPKELVPRD